MRKRTVNRSSKPKLGRPSSYKIDYNSQALKQCTIYGSTDRQLAAYFGVSVSAVKVWGQTHPSFKANIQKGRDAYDTNHVERTMLEVALGWEGVDKTEEYVVRNGKEYHYKKVPNEVGKGSHDELMPGRMITIKIKQHSPNITALIFWLINRTRHTKRWQNTNKVEITGGDGKPLEMINRDMDPKKATQIYLELVKAKQAYEKKAV